MKNVTTLILLGGAALAGSAFAGPAAVAPTPAPDAGLNSALSVGYASQYIHRGINIGDDLVNAKLATSFTCPLTGLGVDASAEYYSVKNGIINDELRLNLGTSKELCYGLTAHVGYTFYHYFDQVNGLNDDTEVYFGLSTQVAGFDTSLVYNWGIDGDFRGNNEGYTELNIGRGFEVLGYALYANTELGYQIETGDLSHVTASLSYDHKLTETATLTPFVAYTWELDGLEGAIPAAGQLDQQNELFAGAALKVTF